MHLWFQTTAVYVCTFSVIFLREYALFLSSENGMADMLVFNQLNCQPSHITEFPKWLHSFTNLQIYPQLTVRSNYASMNFILQT